MKMAEGLKFPKNYPLLIGAAAILGLLISGWVLNLRLGSLKKNNLKNKELLNQALANFSDQSLSQLKNELKNLKGRTLSLINLFEPREQWEKKDYDFSIYFVEELNNTNKFLKEKAAGKQINYTELSFKEKMPSETDAIPMLNQLYGIKEIVSIGMDYNMNFNALNPLGIEEPEKQKGIRLAKSRIQLSGPKQSLMEFVIQLNEIVPRATPESFLLKTQDSTVDLDLTLNHTIVDLDSKEIEGIAVNSDVKEDVSAAGMSFVNILRSNNPFTVPLEKEISAIQGTETKAQAQEAKPMARFYYKGKAVLKSREVVAVEDVLNQETVFLAKDEKIGNFKLKDFSDEEIVLENIDNGQQAMIKRQEQPEAKKETK